MKAKRVFLTGATGMMGGEALKSLLSRGEKFHVIALSLNSEKNQEFYKLYEGTPNLTVIWGDLTNYSDVLKCVSGSDYVIHCAAFVSPAADRYPKEAMEINYGGTMNIIKAILSQPNADEIKFVNIGTVAETGDRMPPIHWGRVGDPIKPSIHDYYAVSKVAAERAVIESGIKHWVSLRQTGIASLKEFSLQEGIMFHQPLNNVLEWVTAKDSGVLCANCCEDWVEDAFWGHVYNIGGGESCRCTMYELQEKLMRQLGIEDVRKTCEPNWYATHNFHGQWYLDSDKLEHFIKFRSQSMDDFAEEYGLAMRSLMQNQTHSTSTMPTVEQIASSIKMQNQQIAMSDTGTLHWLLNNKDEMVDSFFISRKKWAEIPGWNKFVLYRPLDVPIVIDHGYDEEKPESELDIYDMKEAAEFRGGKCLSNDMELGDWRTKLTFKCAFGHEFTASPRLVLEGGHWCDQCERESWNYHELAKRSPFFAQVWYPLHDIDEPLRVYPKIVNENEVK